jgi:hypothetical protein
MAGRGNGDLRSTVRTLEASLDFASKRPACRSRRTAKIIYGLVPVTEELRQHLRDGRVILAGSLIRDNAPTWHCNGCGLDGGRIDLSEWGIKAPRSSMHPLLVLVLILLGCELVLAPILLGVTYLTMDRPLVGYGIWISFGYGPSVIAFVISRCRGRCSKGWESTAKPKRGSQQAYLWDRELDG